MQYSSEIARNTKHIQYARSNMQYAMEAQKTIINDQYAIIN